MRDRSTAALVALVLALSLAAPVAAGPLEDAATARKRGDYATALRLMRPLADQGNAEAQYDLGRAYNFGQGVPEDFAEAARWFRKAAEQGHSEAQLSLGYAYDQGEGVPKDHAEAARWYRKAAEQGNSTAQSNLVHMYAKGLGVPKDYDEAARWFRKAAAQGDTSAQSALGLRWSRDAAAQGDADAQFKLGVMYAKGQGVPQDYVQAHKWFNLAASRFPASDAERRGKAASGRDAVAAKMTPAQIAEAQKLAREWKPK